MSSELGPYGTTEEFFKGRILLMKNRPPCPTCRRKTNVNIFIQLAPVKWICSHDNTKWNQEVL